MQRRVVQRSRAPYKEGWGGREGGGEGEGGRWLEGGLRDGDRIVICGVGSCPDARKDSVSALRGAKLYGMRIMRADPIKPSGFLKFDLCKNRTCACIFVDLP